MSIGIVGLGKMGIPITKNFIKARYKVNVYDKDRSTFKPLINSGAKALNSLDNVGKSSDCIFLMVYPPKLSFKIIFDKNKGLLKGINRRIRDKKNRLRTIIIDGGNADYLRSIEIERELNKLGVDYVDYMDVGFSGGPSGAKHANLSAYVGGNRNVFNKIRPLLSVLCDGNKINYMGKLGSGHFAKIIAHNASEYGIMGVIGEIASLSNKVGDHKKIMLAVNSGLAETRLGELYLKLTNKEIERTGCKIDVTQNAAELALREAKKYGIGMPMITTIYHLRKISDELYESGRISETTKNDMIQDMRSQLDMLEKEQGMTGTVRSMAIQALLRKAFGGHDIYKSKS